MAETTQARKPMIKVHIVVVKKGTAGAEDAFELKDGYVNEEKIEQMFEHELRRDIPLIGQVDGKEVVNEMNVTSIMLESGRSVVVTENMDEISQKILGAGQPPFRSSL